MVILENHLRKYHIKKKIVARSDQTYTDVAKQTVLAQQDVDASLIVASPIVFMEILVLSFWNLKIGFIIRNYVPHIFMTIATKYFNYVSA